MIVEVLLVGLAAWRVSSLVTSEAGPGDIFHRLRARVGADDDATIPDGSLAQLFSCGWCFSVWAAAGLWALWEWVAVWPVAILAAATVAILADESARRLRKW